MKTSDRIDHDREQEPAVDAGSFEAGWRLNLDTALMLLVLAVAVIVVTFCGVVFFARGPWY